MPARADRASDVLARVSEIARALTAGDPAEAMTPFDKSFPKYEKLSDYFVGLASAFQIDNEVSVTDEEDTDTETKLTVNWTLTLTNLVTNYTERRTADINVRLVLKSGTWKIVDFTPIDIFSPQQHRG